MTGIVTGLGWPLLAAFIIGLVALAIKEPKKFQRIDNYLYWTGIAIVVVVGAWQAGYLKGRRDTLNSVDNVDLANPTYIVVGGGAWVAFLFVLWMLSRHLNDE